MDRLKAVTGIICAAVLFSGGCQETQTVTQTSSAQSKEAQRCMYSGFDPVKLEILPLTEVKVSSDNGSKVNVLLTLSDTFNCQQKFPGAFRFELYEYVARSVEPKGKRLILWPDIDLNNPAQNNKYWRNYLRAYEFELLLDTSLDKTCILEITFLTADQKRLNSDITINP
ncbi:MAG: hypothetical protein ISS77_03210 [Phycisphaerae bacterium]|nr:hypothetical protein [Phycisphaerae bacterium]